MRVLGRFCVCARANVPACVFWTLGHQICSRLCVAIGGFTWITLPPTSFSLYSTAIDCFLLLWTILLILCQKLTRSRRVQQHLFSCAKKKKKHVSVVLIKAPLNKCQISCTRFKLLRGYIPCKNYMRVKVVVSPGMTADILQGKKTQYLDLFKDTVALYTYPRHSKIFLSQCWRCNFSGNMDLPESWLL